jgi:nucleotide-binding universal stress UspA family protein
MHNLSAAREDFRQARQQAAMEDLLARFTGRSMDLLSFEEVRRKLRATDMTERGLHEVPISAIVGTTGRYGDFTRTFLPRAGVDESRWANVKTAAVDATGLPPVELYKIGAAYFVKDGHHRVSVAKQLGAESVQAYVTEVLAKINLSPTDQPDDLIRKAEYVEFLEATGLDQTRPGADLSVSVPGQYAKLRDLIELSGFVLETEQGHDLGDRDVLANWYDHEYLPVVNVIRERGMLRDFPGRTETDLYVWMAEHSAELRDELGWSVKPSEVVADLAEKFSPRRQRLSRRLFNLVIPDSLVDGPEAGAWRKEKLEDRYVNRLFERILVPVSGELIGWVGLDQAAEVARREWGELLGLHALPNESARNSQAAQEVREEFSRRCEGLKLPGSLALEVGEVAAKICERAALADLVVLNLAHPPGSGPLARLGSGFRTIIRRSPRPILAVPGRVSAMQRLLLAYDGSSKAKEALFVATYMAGEWRSALTVLTAAEGDVEYDVLQYVRKYLEFHEVNAEFVEARGSAANAILATAAERECDLILMGGYGAHPVVEVVLGSSVDWVLREAQQPILICR